jgi:hypothetical protein
MRAVAMVERVGADEGKESGSDPNKGIHRG